MKNLKIYKNIGLLVGGVTLAGAISYNLCSSGLNLKQFENNEYNLHKVTIENYTKHGIIFDSYYGYEKEADYIIIKEPYMDNINSYSRFVYKHELNNIENEQKDFLTENITNLELLLEQDYIFKIINKVGTNNSEISHERTYELPNTNNYEIEYINVDVNYNDFKIISSDQIDLRANLYFLIMTGAITGVEVAIYSTFKKALSLQEENKKKILKKEIK